MVIVYSDTQCLQSLGTRGRISSLDDPHSSIVYYRPLKAFQKFSDLTIVDVFSQL